MKPASWWVGACTDHLAELELATVIRGGTVERLAI